MKTLVVFFASLITLASPVVASPSVAPTPIFNGNSLTASATSAAVTILNTDNVSLQFNVGTSTPAALGAFYVDECNDYVPASGNPGAPAANPGTWTTLTLSPAPTASGPGASVFLQDLNQQGAGFLRVRYVETTTGAGVFSVYVLGKAFHQ
jgi:hypothetical protein